MKVLVIGAGILGLSVSQALVASGHDIDLIDKEGVFAGASHRSFAWINANHKLPEAYFALNNAGIEEHHAFQRAHADRGTWVHAHGCILADLTENAEDTYTSRFAEAVALGYPVQRLGRSELEELEPAVKWDENIRSALLYTRDGHIDNDILGRVLVDLLADAGVTVRTAEAYSIQSRRGGATVSFTSGERQSYDKVVIAAGAESRFLAQRSAMFLPVADLSVPGPRTHSFLGVTAVTEVAVHRVIVSDAINVRPRHDGRFFVQIPPVEDRTREGESEELLDEIRQVMETALETFFGTSIPVETVYFSGRSFPEDGLSIVGYMDESANVYSLVTHSGMTMGPLLGRLAASELDGHREELLDAFRPSRFRAGMKQKEQGSFIGRQ